MIPARFISTGGCRTARLLCLVSVSMCVLGRILTTLIASQNSPDTNLVVIPVSQSLLPASLPTKHWPPGYLNDTTSPQPPVPTPVSAACTPRPAVYFLQVVKTASTTMQNLLNRQRFTYDDLNLAFMPTFSYPNPDTIHFLASYVRDAAQHGKRFAMLHQHTVYNATAIDQFMAPEVAYVASLRQPLEQFASIYDFIDYERLVFEKRDNDSLRMFLTDPIYFDEKYMLNGIYVSPVHNPTARAFGYHAFWRADEKLSAFVSTSLQRFEHVILRERFVESLALYRRKLCLRFEDVAIFLNLRRQRKRRTETLASLDAQHLQNHRRFCSVDYALYDAFRLRFEREISAQTDDFHDEVARIDAVSTRVAAFCKKAICQIKRADVSNTTLVAAILKGHARHPDLLVEASPWHKEMRLRTLDCYWMAMGPLQFERSYVEAVIDRGCKERGKYVYCYDTAPFVDYLTGVFTTGFLSHRKVRMQNMLLFC